MSARFSRRNFLRGSAGTALALPLLESSFANAQSAATGTPLRLVIYQSGQGNLPKRWIPKTQANDALELSEMLQPLSAHQDKLVVVSGMSNAVALAQVGSAHVTSGHTLMSAALIDTTRTGKNDPGITAELSMLCLGPSVDHYLANKLQSPLPINLGIGTDQTGENQMWWKVKAAGATGANPAAPVVINPVTAFKTYLTGLSAGTTTTPTRADRFRAQRLSVLDGVLGSFKQVSTKVSTADNVRLQMHADAIRSIEQGLNKVPPMQCNMLSQKLPDGYKAPSYPEWVGLDVSAKLQIDLAVNALACGASPIVTIQETEYGAPRFEFLPEGPVKNWHAMIHNDPALGLNLASTNDNPAVKAGLLYYARNFNYLLQSMNAIMEPNGKTMLDNSLVVWISEFGEGERHSLNNLPVVIAGSAQGKIKGNRHLARPKATTGDLWTSVVNAFGLPDTSFGYNDKAGFNNGGIQGLLG